MRDFTAILRYDSGTYDAKILLNDEHIGVDRFQATWYPIPHANVELSKDEIYRGSYKHTQCLKFASEGKHICAKCQTIPNLPSFKRRILLRADKVNDDGKRDLNCIRFEYLNSVERLELLRLKNKELEKKDSSLFLVGQMNLRLKLRVRSFKERIREFSKRGDMKSICHQLVKADEKGLFKEKRVLMDTLDSVSRNFHVRGSQGRRYKDAVKRFYESLKIMGGPRICNFVAVNLEGPSLDAVYKWRKTNLIDFKPGITEENFKQLFLLLKGLMDRNSIPKVPWLTAEDETAIEKNITYLQENDELLGFCGKETENSKDHVCLSNFHIIIGDDDESYAKMINAFKSYRKGNYARVVLLNPLHRRLPRLVICLVATCNCFSHFDVFNQWREIETYFGRHLEEVAGPLIGHSSDGDSRRRKLMVQMMLTDEGERFRPIEEEKGFIFSARKVACEEGPLGPSYLIKDVGDQDPIHNHKKYINHLDHVSKVIYIGPGLVVLMNHIEIFIERISVLKHGLNKEHVRRERDRQNWKTAQELCSIKVQKCLSDIKDGTADKLPPDPSVRGTIAFLNVIWHYVEIFFSPVLPLKERIKYAGFVAHFLEIRRNFIHWEPSLEISKNFISNQTYVDILLSVHTAVVVICFLRDQYQELECPLDRLGSDCCEDFFSQNVQFIGNHPVYPFGQMVRNVKHMIRLSEIQADPNAPSFMKPHIKQGKVWDKQFHVDAQRASLKEYPEEGEEVKLWEEGIGMARQLAKEVGITPEYFDNYGYDGDEGLHDWFEHPFTSGDHKALFSRLKNNTVNHDMNEEGDDLDDGSHDSSGRLCGKIVVLDFTLTIMHIF